MAAIVWGDVTAHAPHMSTVSSTAQTDILAHVNTLLSVSNFGGESSAKTRYARILLACHFGQSQINAASGAAGAVISKKLGDMSIGYADPSGSLSVAGSPYASTIYGKTYLAIVRNTVARVGVVL